MKRKAKTPTGPPKFSPEVRPDIYARKCPKHPRKPPRWIIVQEGRRAPLCFWCGLDKVELMRRARFGDDDSDRNGFEAGWA